MRKSIFAIMGILLIFAAVACTQNPVDLPEQKPGGEGELGTWNINNTEDLQRFFSFEGTATARMNLTVDPSSSMFPMTIVGDKTFSGDIGVGGATGASYASNITPPHRSGTTRVADGKQLFVVANGASVTLSNLEVTVSEEAAAQISAVVAVNNSKISADNYNVTVTGSTTAVTGIAIGADTAAENITISNSKPGNIYVSPDNKADSDIQKDIVADNPDIVVETKYNAATTTDFINILADYGYVVLTQDIVLDGATLKSINKLYGKAVSGDIEYPFIFFQGSDAVKYYEIDLNSHKIDSKVCWYLPTDGVTVEMHDGTIDIDADSLWSKANSAVQLCQGTTLIIDNVDLAMDIAGIHIAEKQNDMTLTVRNGSKITADNNTISTNASLPVSQEINIAVTDSDIIGIDGIGIFFNVPGNLTLTNSNISGVWHGVLVRGGNATITGGSITASCDENSNPYETQDWGSGNLIPFAALIIGNRANGYEYPTICNVTGTEISMTGTGTLNHRIYIAASNGKDCSVTATLPDDYKEEVLSTKSYWIRDLANDVLTLNGEKLTANPE